MQLVNSHQEVLAELVSLIEKVTIDGLKARI